MTLNLSCGRLAQHSIQHLPESAFEHQACGDRLAHDRVFRWTQLADVALGHIHLDEARTGCELTQVIDPAHFAVARVARASSLFLFLPDVVKRWVKVSQV